MVLPGPEYYRALLAQQEEDIPKPKRAPSTLEAVNTIRKQWIRFCCQIWGPKVEPLERLRTISLRDLQVFFRWYIQSNNPRKVKSILNKIKDWNMMYRDDVGRGLEKEVIWQINTYTRVTLSKDFDLDPTLSLKESANQDDLHNLLKYLWEQDTHIYPVERQRPQTAFITQLIALTTVRPGALVESGCYRGTDQALLYRDIVMRLVRDPEDLSQTVLLMEVTVTLWKGERETMKPVTFVFYEHDCLMFCPILHMLGLAFADNAFDSEEIQSLQDIYSHKIPDFKESTKLKWKDEWMLRPIFRRACSTPGGLTTSLVKALPYTSFASQISALGAGAGFKAAFTAYAFRRGAAQVVNKIATAAERNQIMGHSNSQIFERYYQNRVVSTDISAAFLKMPSRSSLLASIGHIGIDRDPRAPLHLELEERQAVLSDQRLVRINVQIYNLRTSCPKEYRPHGGRGKLALSATQEQELNALNKTRRGLRKQLLRDAANTKRRQFFERIDNDDLRQTKRGIPVTYTPALPVYALSARANLARIFCQVDVNGTKASQRDRRIEALESLIELCKTREPHHMNPGSRVNTSGVKDTQLEDGSSDLRDAFKTMELVPLVLPSTICLFCLGDVELVAEARTASFSRIDSLRRHVDEQHLAHYVHGTLLLCPHPSCDAQCSDSSEFKNHAATVHNVWLSR